MKISMDMKGLAEFRDAIKLMMANTKNKAPFFREAKVIMFADVQRHFQNEEGPVGKWDPLKYRTGKILQDTGRLRASIATASSGEYAEVGTNMVYAPVHQFGYAKRNIPQRMFVWLSDEAKERILDNTVKYFWGDVK